MPGQRIVLELAQHGPAEHVRQEYIQRNRGRLELLGKVQRLGAARRHQDLESLVACEINQYPRIMRIIFDDQKDSVSGLEVEPVIRNLLDGALLRRHRQRRCNVVLRRRADPRRHRGPGIFQGQIEGEDAALARRALKVNFSAQQVRQLAADRKTKAGAAIFPAGACVGLLKCLEDQLLFFQRNADPGIGHLKGDHGGRLIEDRMLGTPAANRGRYAHTYAAVGGELERIRQQILQHLLQPL